MHYQVTTDFDESSVNFDDIKKTNLILSNNYKMKYDGNIELSLYQKVKSKFTMLIRTNSNFDQSYRIDVVVADYLQECFNCKVNFIIETLTNESVSQILEKNKKKTTNSESNDVLACYEFISSVCYKHKNSLIEYRETILRQQPPMDSQVLLTSYNQETKRITEKVTDRFIGHPVHYQVIGNQDKDIHTLVTALAYVLYQNHRLLHPLVVSARFDELNIFDERYEIETLMPLCDGGLLLLDIDDTYFEHLPFDQKKDALKNIAKSVLDNRHNVLTVIISDSYESESYKLIHSELTEIAFVDLVEERLGFNDAKNYLYELVSRIDKSNNIADSLLDKNKSFYSVMEIKDIFNSWRNKHILLSTYSQYNGLSPYQQKVEEPLVKGTAYKQFQSLVGLDDIKSLVDQILMAHEAHKIYLTYGINPEPTNMHMLFMGDPGTAKTTTARLIAQIFKDNSILSVGNLIEVDRSQIIERYVGWTAKNVKSLFAKAKGSILFIDEAYSLLDNTLGSYGDEAINAIVQEMENSREDTIVIFAGYTKEMTDFINKNPGLKSRVNYTVQFKNYCVEELVQIAKSIINNMGFNVAESALELCKHLFRKESSDINFGNGRYVRNVVEKAIVNHGCRISQENDDLDKETVLTLQPEDFEPLLYKNTLYSNKQSKILS